MRLFYFLLIIPLSQPSFAEFFEPIHSNYIVAELPPASKNKEINNLIRAVDQDPNNIDKKIMLVNAYLNVAKQTADPRFYGYADAKLKTILEQAPDNREARYLQAEILQHQHEYSAALSVLNKLISQEDMPAARLLRATVHQSTGEYEQALQDCKSLIVKSDHLVAVTCVLFAESHLGKLEESYTELSSLSPMFNRAPKDVQSWIYAAAGEMAFRMGKNHLAEQHLTKSIALDSANLFARVTLADAYIAQNRLEMAAQLADEYSSVTPIKLKIARATQQKELVDDIRNIFKAQKRRNDDTHMREYAEFLLYIENNAEAALEAAKRNWTVQKMPEDALLLAQAAAQDCDVDTINLLSDWTSSKNFESATLSAVISSSRECAK